MSSLSLSQSIASFARDYDPYDFADNFDSFADAVEHVSQLLESRPALIVSALAAMAHNTEIVEERLQAMRLVSMVCGYACNCVASV